MVVMCYISGIIGNFKGVVYSYCLSFLYMMVVCIINGIGVGFSDKVLLIVLMFYVNGWGLLYVVLMVGVDLVLFDWYFDVCLLIYMVEMLKLMLVGVVLIIWNDVMYYLEKDFDYDMLLLCLVVCGGLVVLELLMCIFEDKYDV